MNTKLLVPLTAAILLAAAVVPAVLGHRPIAAAASSPRIVDLPAVVVRPAPEDAAWYQAHKIVDLATVTVHPDPADLAVFVADTARVASCLC